MSLDRVDLARTPRKVASKVHDKMCHMIDSLCEPASTSCTSATSAKGAMPLYERFPRLIPVVCDFVKQFGMSAQARRRSGIANVGVGLKDIRDHVQLVIPDITNWGISTDTIAH